MAVIAIVAGGVIGLINGLIGLVTGLGLGAALLVWIVAGSLSALLIFRQFLTGTAGNRSDRQMDAVYDDLLSLGEDEIRRASLAATDASSMSRLVRIYAERDAQIASAREYRRSIAEPDRLAV